MKLTDLFIRPLPDFRDSDDFNPFLAEEGFDEAQLIDIRIDALHCTVGMLYEMRPSTMQYNMEDLSVEAGVLILRESTGVEWKAVPTGRPNPHSWAVMSSSHAIHGHQLELVLELGLIGGMDFRATAAAAEFYVGRMPALPDEIPSYPDHVDVSGLVPGWDMEFFPTHGWHIGAQ
jgi:hypothetical protein